MPVLYRMLLRCGSVSTALPRTCRSRTAASTRGATVCDRFGVLGRAPNAQVATALDVPRFWELVIDAIARSHG